jgi:hypothetical protein
VGQIASEHPGEVGLADDRELVGDLQDGRDAHPVREERVLAE